MATSSNNSSLPPPSNLGSNNNAGAVRNLLKAKENSNSKGGNFKPPPLLEYWKPPKAVVFAPGSDNLKAKRDSSALRKQEKEERRTSIHFSDIESAKIRVKERLNSSVYGPTTYDINTRTTRSNSIASDTTATTTNSDNLSTLSITTSNFSSISRPNNRFTWADSTTKLIGIKDTDSSSLRSVPWGYDSKDKNQVKVSEREITPTSSPDSTTSRSKPILIMSEYPPAYRFDDDSATLKPHWWQVQHWSRKKMALVGLGVAAVLAIIIAVVVEVKKANAYPNYTTLNYSKVDEFTGTEFFDNFNYFTATDPTSGFAQYVDEQTAAQLNLTYAGSSSAVLRVDTSDSNAVSGRQTVRITSKNTWDTGLFIFDVVHTPYGCATWPALWLSDPDNWPTNGEIDVMEQVNQATDGNIMTLHTTNDCSMSVKRKETGTVSAKNCYNGTDDNAGCGVTGSSDTYGQAFNNKGGGIMAMELRSAGIRMWQFLRSEIPSDITAQTPDPSTWGEALADFPSTDCDIGSHFRNQSIIVNIEICGSWAGATSVYSDEDQCPGTCTQYAQTNATAFETAYFEFGNFTVYQSQ